MIRLAIVIYSLIVSSTMFNAEAATHPCKVQNKLEAWVHW